MALHDYAESLREVPITEVLAALKLKPHREGKSVMWKDKTHSVNTTGQKWFDHEAGHGGYGAIDLAMHLCRLDFRGAAQWLSNLQQTTGIPELRARYESLETASEPKHLTWAETRDQHAQPTEETWRFGRQYLVECRRIDPALVDALHHSGDLYTNERTGVVFVHRTLEGKIAGASIRSSIHRSTFRQSIGNKLSAWFTTAGPAFPWEESERPVAILESAIDALSYSTLHGDNPVCLSVGGNYVPEVLVAILGRSTREVILALDNDLAGKRGIESAISRLEQLGPEMRCRLTAHLPLLKDWNADLCAKIQTRLTL